METLIEMLVTVYNSLNYLTFSNFYAGITRNEIVSNSIIMLLAGYENSNNLLTFLSYNLATHKDCQDRLRREIQEAMASHNVSGSVISS